jgi:hypothetical protein
MSGPHTSSEGSILAGQRYRASCDIQVLVQTSWHAAFTGGSEATLPAAEEFSIVISPPDGASAAICRPARYDQLHGQLVAESDRRSPNYAGYGLIITLETIRSSCELLI